jgi:hypothetical protein
MKQITNKVLTSARLKKMGKKKLIDLADSMATRLIWLHSVGKNETNPEQYKRLASELYHVAEIIEWKESVKKTKKYDFNK